ncbi:HNH endonuclease [Leuconostoc citreum]|uniref:HNH endonuclease n=1 Tax=Leuconostoc citreum TaxID=33964 RepID=UPI0035CEAD22
MFPNRKWSEIYTKARRLGRKYDPYSREFINGNGYKLIRINGKYQPEHRRIVEKNIGRKLKHEEIVHHIDFNKQNNDIENLHVFKNTSEHIKCHRGVAKVLSELLARNIIEFNASTGEYEICKNQ